MISLDRPVKQNHILWKSVPSTGVRAAGKLDPLDLRN